MYRPAKPAPITTASNVPFSAGRVASPAAFSWAMTPLRPCFYLCRSSLEAATGRLGRLRRDLQAIVLPRHEWHICSVSVEFGLFLSRQRRVPHYETVIGA